MNDFTNGGVAIDPEELESDRKSRQAPERKRKSKPRSFIRFWRIDVYSPRGAYLPEFTACRILTVLALPFSHSTHRPSQRCLSTITLLTKTSFATI